MDVIQAVDVVDELRGPRSFRSPNLFIPLDAANVARKKIQVSVTTTTVVLASESSKLAVTRLKYLIGSFITTFRAV